MSLGKSKIRLPLPSLGMRNIKSAIAVFGCFLAWQGVRLVFPTFDSHPLYAYASVILSMRDTTENSLIYGKIRVRATIIGLIVALLSISLFIELYPLMGGVMQSVLEILILMLGVMASLYAAYVFRCDNFCAIAGVVFLVCMVRYNAENRYIYALLRTVETILGITISLFVNKTIFPYHKEKDL